MTWATIHKYSGLKIHSFVHLFCVCTSLYLSDVFLTYFAALVLPSDELTLKWWQMLLSHTLILILLSCILINIIVQVGTFIKITIMNEFFVFESPVLTMSHNGNRITYFWYIKFNYFKCIFYIYRNIKMQIWTLAKMNSPSGHPM